jgi:hypothetical protein
MSDVGFIYCMSNPAFKDGMVKIGFTLRTVEERCRELRTTGVPLPFVVEFAKQVSNPAEKEKYLHEILADMRISDDREFFNIPVEEVKTLFEMFEGPWWVQEESQSSIRKRVSQEERDEEARASLARAEERAAEKLARQEFKDQEKIRRLEQSIRRAEQRAADKARWNQMCKALMDSDDEY